MRSRKVSRGAGQRRVAMNDVERYRMNAAECILAAERCEPAYRDLTFALAETWLSLARHEEVMHGLLAIWSSATSATSIVSTPHSV
jgi:hypothetical protein